MALSAKGRQTRQAITDAARMLFAERGFHRTTLGDITAAAGKSTASFYRYFADKEDLLATLAEHLLADLADLPASRTDGDFFVATVGAYWHAFQPSIGVMVAVDQLAATEPRFTRLQNAFRRYGMAVVRASVLRAQQQGYAADLNPEHIALAIVALFERFTSISRSAGISDADAVATLSTIWRRTLYNPSTQG